MAFTGCELKDSYQGALKCLLWTITEGLFEEKGAPKFTAPSRDSVAMLFLLQSPSMELLFPDLEE